MNIDLASMLTWRRWAASDKDQCHPGHIVRVRGSHWGRCRSGTDENQCLAGTCRHPRASAALDWGIS